MLSEYALLLELLPLLFVTGGFLVLALIYFTTQQ